LAGLIEPLSDVFPVSDIPDGIDIIWTNILILKIISMLPDIDAEKGDQA
jgi:hypothetical protein